MRNLTVHQRINFKSHYPSDKICGFERIKRVDPYGHYAEKNSNSKSFDIPYWNELQGYRFTTLSAFELKN